MIRLILPSSLKFISIDTRAVSNLGASLAGRSGLIALWKEKAHQSASRNAFFARAGSAGTNWVIAQASSPSQEQACTVPVSESPLP